MDTTSPQIEDDAQAQIADDPLSPYPAEIAAEVVERIPTLRGTNVAKHARARHARVSARIEDGALAVRVRDDGIGRARPEGSGLLGLAGRLVAVDGRLRVESFTDGGTLIAADIPPITLVVERP